MEQERDQIVTLTDDNGNETDFDMVLAFDYEGKRYAALLPIGEVEGVGEDEVVLLEMVDNGDEVLFNSVESEVLLDELFELFLELFNKDLDEQDEEDDK